MFKDLKNGSLVYILNRLDKLVYKIGSVDQVKEIPGQFPYQMNQYISIVVNVDGNSQYYEQLPSDKSITTNGTITISCNQNDLGNEVNNIVRASMEIVNRHESIISEGNKILKQLNPDYAKHSEQEDKIKKLEQEISEMRNLLGGMDEINRMISETKNNNVKQTNSK